MYYMSVFNPIYYLMFTGVKRFYRDVIKPIARGNGIKFKDIFNYAFYITQPQNITEGQINNSKYENSNDLKKYCYIACSLSYSRQDPINNGIFSICIAIQYMMYDTYFYNTKYVTWTEKQDLLLFINKIAKLDYDIVAFTIEKSDTKPYLPYCFILKNDKETIVISRGSYTGGDYNTDFDMEVIYDEFDGQVYGFHKGFYMQAQNVIKFVEENIKDYSNIIFTGHSLGGAVSTVASYLLLKKGHKNKCYAYSPPPSCTINASLFLKDNNVYSIIMDRDIVPRLSVHAVKVCFERLKLIKLQQPINQEILRNRCLDRDTDCFVGGTCLYHKHGKFGIVQCEEVSEMFISIPYMSDHYCNEFVRQYI